MAVSPCRFYVDIIDNIVCGMAAVVPRKFICRIYEGSINGYPNVSAPPLWVVDATAVRKTSQSAHRRSYDAHVPEMRHETMRVCMAVAGQPRACGGASDGRTSHDLYPSEAVGKVTRVHPAVLPLMTLGRLAHVAIPLECRQARWASGPEQNSHRHAHSKARMARVSVLLAVCAQRCRALGAQKMSASVVPALYVHRRHVQCRGSLIGRGKIQGGPMVAEVGSELLESSNASISRCDQRVVNESPGTNWHGKDFVAASINGVVDHVRDLKLDRVVWIERKSALCMREAHVHYAGFVRRSLRVRLKWSFQQFRQVDIDVPPCDRPRSGIAESYMKEIVVLNNLAAIVPKVLLSAKPHRKVRKRDGLSVVGTMRCSDRRCRLGRGDLVLSNEVAIQLFEMSHEVGRK